MTRPFRYLLRMMIFLAAVIIVVGALEAGLQKAFSHNVALNSLILLVLLFGIGLNFRRVVVLNREVRWVEDYRRGQPQISASTPKLLAPLATMLGERRDRFNLTPLTMRSLLDGLSSRFDESHEMAVYFTGLMIFLGLLGTFWGLSQTIGSIGDVIRNLSSAGDDPQSAFAGLKQGLETPLSGMGTAFSTSLIGLAGSLVLGFLDLQAVGAQNAFYNDLEDWLSAQTKISAGTGIGDSGDQSVPAYIQALLEQTADSLDNLQRVIARGEESRIASNTNLRALTERLTTLADQMKTEQSLMLKLAESQMEMKPILQRLAEGRGQQGIDEGTRGHIRNIDSSLARLVEESGSARDEMVRDIRNEFRLLTRTIAVLAEDENQGPDLRAPRDR
ncbi:MAG TPA: flagellar motor protein MotA [Magnetospirillaceae bacterium]